MLSGVGADLIILRHALRNEVHTPFLRSLAPAAFHRHQTRGVVTTSADRSRWQDGSDRNGLEPFKSLASFRKNGLDVSIEFVAAPLPLSHARFAFALTKKTMQKICNSSGYG